MFMVYSGDDVMSRSVATLLFIGACPVILIILILTKIYEVEV